MSALLKHFGLAFALSAVCTDTALNSTLFFVVPDGWILKEENTSGRDICLFWRTTNNVDLQPPAVWWTGCPKLQNIHPYWSQAPSIPMHSHTGIHTPQLGSLQCWFFKLLKSTQSKIMKIITIFSALVWATQFLQLVCTSFCACVCCRVSKSVTKLTTSVNQGGKRRKKRSLLSHNRFNWTGTMHDF